MANHHSRALDPAPSTYKKTGLLTRSDNPILAKVMEERSRQLQQPQDQNTFLLERGALESRVIIIEGISGSGKDTFQTYLKQTLKGRDVHDYAEGDLLQSWKQLQIEGVFDLRVKLMKLFLNYVKDVINREDNAVFLLNRFHLSTYVSTIVHYPRLKTEYDEILTLLRTLPVHVFILQLDESEIEERSSHPERSTTWQKHQIQIAKKEGFHDALRRHLWQQQLVLEAAQKQQIPYSVLKLSPTREIEDVQLPTSATSSNLRRSARINAGNLKSSQRKRGLSRPL